MTDRLAEGVPANDDLQATLEALPPEITEGGRVTLRAGPEGDFQYQFDTQEGNDPVPDPDQPHVAHWDTTGLAPGSYVASVTVTRLYGGNQATSTADVTVRLRPTAAGETVPVSLQRTGLPHTGDQAFWIAIRNSTNALSFERYQQFIDDIMCNRGGLPAGTKRSLRQLDHRRALPYPDVDAYRLLKIATEVFMMSRCGVRIDPRQLGAPFQGLNLDEELTRLDGGGFPTEEAAFQREIQRLWGKYVAPIENGRDLATVPYLAAIRAKLGDVDLVAGEERFARACFGILRGKLTNPCLIELIWSYWHEEGMLVQTLNAIALRFQNQRGPLDPDPLAQLEIDPLRPLNNLLWGYVQDEEHRLTLLRRAYEYDHHYGLALLGKAVPVLRPADSRSKFLEAFHNLLNLAYLFYRDDDDTTVKPDAFPLLNGLKEVHLLLTEGQHNQYGDLPWTARQEMLMQEWLLARPEMREFLPGRVMVAYPEPWMDRVDAMKRLQGWTDTSVVHFRDLGVFGERLLLSIRFGDWNDVIDATQAANWARYWRPEAQGYIHAYRAVTGVDLTLEPVNTTMPSVLLRRRLADQLRQLGGGRDGLPARRPRVQLTRRPTPLLGEAPVRGQLPSGVEHQ